MGCIDISPFEADERREVLSVLSWSPPTSATQAQRTLTFSRRGVYWVVCFAADSYSYGRNEYPGYGDEPHYENIETDDGDVYEPAVPYVATLFAAIWVHRRVGGTVAVNLGDMYSYAHRLVFLVLGPPDAQVTWGGAT